MRNDLIGVMIHKTMLEAKKGMRVEKKLHDTVTDYYTGGRQNRNKKQTSERTRMTRSLYGY